MIYSFLFLCNKNEYFGHLMRRIDSLEKTLMLGGIRGRRRRGQQRMRWLDGITDSMHVSLSDSGSWWWTGRPRMLQFMGSQRVGHDRATEVNWWFTHFYFCVIVYLMKTNKLLFNPKKKKRRRSKLSFKGRVFILKLGWESLISKSKGEYPEV